jgi:hypothetical protein
MNNHFYISYAGNKRNEAEKLYNLLDLTNIKNIVEPFCGSCAMSYFIYIKNKDKNLKYYLNDNNKYLKEMFEIIRDDNKQADFDDKIKKIIEKVKNNKEEYKKVIKSDDIYGWFIKNKYYRIRPGLFQIDIKGWNFKPIKEYPIYDFFKNANITFTLDDGTNIFKNFKDDKTTLILMDPPYMMSNNDFYLDSSINIYEYVLSLDLKKLKSKIYFILEKNWIMEVLFKNINSIEYDKKYNNHNKKKTTHKIYTNQKIKNI